MRHRARLADVASDAAVSVTTASLVLNGRDTSIPPDTRQRVWDAAQRLGYYPDASARALVTGRTNRLGVVFNEPESFGVNDFYFAEVLPGIIDQAVTHDRDLVLHTTHYRDWRSLCSRILGGAADGAILVGRVPRDELTTALLDAEFPTVCVSYALDHPRCVSVDCDNVQGAYLAVRHLLCLGHRHLALLYPGEVHSWGSERRQGALRAVLEAGLGDEALTTHSWGETTLPPAEWARDVAAAIAEANPRPTAVVCCDEGRAEMLLDTLPAAGLSVPEHCSVVSFNSTQISARSTPPMTSVWQPLRQLGEVAVDLLVDLIEGRSIPTRVHRFPMRLDVRESCSAPLPGAPTHRLDARSPAR